MASRNLPTLTVEETQISEVVLLGSRHSLALVRAGAPAAKSREDSQMMTRRHVPETVCCTCSSVVPKEVPKKVQIAAEVEVEVTRLAV